jgi:hypothetical protein
MAPKQPKLKFYSISLSDSFVRPEASALLGLPKGINQVPVYVVAATAKEATQHLADVQGAVTPRTGTVKISESTDAHALHDMGYLVERGTVLVHGGPSAGRPDRLVRLTPDSMTVLGEWIYDERLRERVFVPITEGDGKTGSDVEQVLAEAITLVAEWMADTSGADWRAVETDIGRGRGDFGLMTTVQSPEGKPKDIVIVDDLHEADARWAALMGPAVGEQVLEWLSDTLLFAESTRAMVKDDPAAFDGYLELGGRSFAAAVAFARRVVDRVGQP